MNYSLKVMLLGGIPHLTEEPLKYTCLNNRSNLFIGF